MVLDGALDQIEAPPVSGITDDSDSDGVANEVPVSLIDHLEFYLLNYFKPGLYQQTNTTRKGKRLFRQIRCTGCHIPDLVIDHDRRVADVETVYDRQGVFNDLFATATPLFTEQEDGSGHPSLKRPSGQAFVVKNIYADFKRHDLGPAFHERNFDGTITKEFVTEPLWGVGSTPSYGHDGRSINLREVIRRHGGEARQSKQRFFKLSTNDQHAILEFLNALVLFPPPDTSSNLNPGDANTPGYPQNGHGSIDLSVLFNDPSDLE